MTLVNLAGTQPGWANLLAAGSDIDGNAGSFICSVCAGEQTARANRAMISAVDSAISSGEQPTPFNNER